jgi:hypothetical protein
VSLHYIDLHYACFGLIVEAGKVVKAPPIAAWAIGKPIAGVRWFYEVKKKARRYVVTEVG